MQKLPLLILAGLVVAGCQPEVPSSGVGFGNYEDYLKQRDAQLEGTGSSSSSATAQPGGTYGASGYGATPVAEDSSAAAAPNASLGADTLAALQATAPGGGQGVSTDQTAQAVTAQTVTPQTVTPQTGGVVSGGVGTAGTPLNAMAPSTITAGTSTSGSGVQSGMASGRPDLAAYAASVHNSVGTPVYQRSAYGKSASAAACKKYGSADLAQMAFLQAGGPSQDKLNLDPDGDGFACGWDPLPFRDGRS